MRVAAQTTRDGIRQYSHCEYVLSRSLPHCKNYSFGHVGLLSSLFSITVQELPQKNVYDHIERRFLHMRTIFTDNIRYSLMCCTKALICIFRIDDHIDKLFFFCSRKDVNTYLKKRSSLTIRKIGALPV